MTLSDANEYVEELVLHALSTKAPERGLAEHMNDNMDPRLHWKEEDMKELLLQLRGYRSGLADLLAEAQEQVSLYS
jgi:hypothetical protein